MKSTVSREEALERAARQLDISPTKYKQAIERYNSISSYLLEGEYGTVSKPEIYLQGSFNIGTEIRPYRNSKDADYDIDIVCRLQNQKEKTSPELIKNQVGDHLKAHDTYSKMLDKEGKRCWTLNYSEQDGIGFHMDILPSVKENLDTQDTDYWYRNSIAVTNKLNSNGFYSWSSSNPKDFAEWFFEQNKIKFEEIKIEQKKALFEEYRDDNIFTDRESIPDFHIKTPLQRAIQILKRHRDVRFCKEKNEKHKPISMVITVLAAKIYRNESTIYETLKNIISVLSQHAEQLNSFFTFSKSLAETNYTFITRTVNDGWYIPNPTNKGENFADRWHEEENGVSHARARAFFQWVKWAAEDLINIDDLISEEYFIKSLVSPSDNKVSSASTKLNIFNVPHRQKPIWPQILNYDVHISARYKHTNSWEALGSGYTLPKHCDLLFHARTNVNPPFDVYWQVVNTGKEAAEAGQLRGNILLSNTTGAGGLSQKESTLYTGFHWIECFIVKNGICLANSGKFVVQIR